MRALQEATVHLMANRNSRVAVLMAVRDGATYLDEQLQSLAMQTWPHIDLWISDDGSQDDTLAVLERWRDRWTKGTFHIRQGPCRGYAENFRSLIVDAAIDADFFAFSDQDDVWDDDKVEAAIVSLSGLDRECALYCSRTRLISESGEEIGYSPHFKVEPSFRNAVLQSIAGGNTMVMNRLAHRVLAKASERTAFVSHDWWSYIVITGVGGKVIYSARPYISYRQHEGNIVGSNTSFMGRLSRLRGLARGQLREWTDRNLNSLGKIDDLLDEDARSVASTLRVARGAGLLRRFLLVRRAGIHRQTLAGNISMYAALLIGRI